MSTLQTNTDAYANSVDPDKIPAGTWRKYNVASTSMQRHDVASTLRRRYIYVMCIDVEATLYLRHVPMT